MRCVWEDPSAVTAAMLGIAKRIVFHRELSIVLLGINEVAEHVIRRVGDRAAKVVVILDRTDPRSLDAARRLGARVEPWSELRRALVQADIVVSSSLESDGLTITKDVMESVMIERSRRIALLFDLSPSRSIEPDIHQMENAFLYDLHDLRAALEPCMCAVRRGERRAERAR